MSGVDDIGGILDKTEGCFLVLDNVGSEGHHFLLSSGQGKIYGTRSNLGSTSRLNYREGFMSRVFPTTLVQKVHG